MNGGFVTDRALLYSDIITLIALWHRLSERAPGARLPPSFSLNKFSGGESGVNYSCRCCGRPLEKRRAYLLIDTFDESAAARGSDRLATTGLPAPHHAAYIVVLINILDDSWRNTR